MDLGQIFENHFDCYADVNKSKSCLPNWYEDKDTMAMTKEKFIEVVTEIVRNGKKQPSEYENKALNIADVKPCYLEYIFYHPENEGTAKTFRDAYNQRWLYENELAELIGIKNVETLKA